MPDSFDYTTGTNSENVRLLQALIDDAPEYTEETNSRNANILKSIINNTEYTDAPQSEIEELLLRLKAKIGGEIEVDELNVTENGTYDAGVNKAYNPVTVAVPLGHKTITANGTYTASDDNLAGFNEVTVAVDGYAKKSIANTPTSIATFNASALPMPSLTVGIEATQDLHGYDSPWVGGAGKNKFPIATATSSGTQNIFTAQTVSLKANTNYVLSFDSATLTTKDMSLSFNNGNTQVRGITISAGVTSVNLTFNQNIDNIDWYVREAVNLSNIMIEEGSTKTAFAPYSNECPITGWSAVDVYRTGKNKFETDFTDTTINGTEIHKLSDGRVTTSGVPTVAFDFVIGHVPLPAGSYILNGCPSGGGATKYRLQVTNYPVSQNLGQDSGSGVSFTLENDMEVAVRIQIYTGASDTLEFEPMIRFASDTDATYEAYNGTTYTTQLKDGQGNPLTCYGGELSNENGVQTLTVTHGYIASYNGETLPSTWISDRDVYAEGTTPTTGAEVAYTLATPQTIPQDNLAIATQDGTNNLWADSGDVLSGEYMEAL